SLGESGGVANATHLGGLAVGYLFLKSGRIHPLSELKYRYLKWKINRVRKKFDVYSGGPADDLDRRVHCRGPLTRAAFHPRRLHGRRTPPTASASVAPSTGSA